MVALSRAVRDYGFGTEAIPVQFNGLVAKSSRLAAKQSEQLDLIGENLATAVGCPTSEALLLGDTAILAVLYDDLGAFPSTFPRVAVPNRVPLSVARRQEIGLYPPTVPGQFAMVMPPALEEVAASLSEPAAVGGHTWLVPRRELLLALIAAHVGHAEAPSRPPVWPHLALAAKHWCREVPVSSILEVGRALGLEQGTQMGLGVIRELFPELENWATSEALRLSTWAARLKVPAAARQLVASTEPKAE